MLYNEKEVHKKVIKCSNTINNLLKKKEIVRFTEN